MRISFRQRRPCRLRTIYKPGLWLRASISGVPVTWKRPRGRPPDTWIPTVEDDLRPANNGLHIAWRRAQNRSDWRTLILLGHSYAPVGALLLMIMMVMVMTMMMISMLGMHLLCI